MQGLYDLVAPLTFMNLLFLPASYTSPSARFRVLQFVEPLRQFGHEVTVRVIRPERVWQSPLQTGILRRLHGRAGTAMRLVSAGAALHDAEDFDVIFMNRDLLPETRIRFVEPLLARSNPRIIFDFDDAIFLGSRGKKLRHILPHVAAVVVGNENLARFARDIHSDITILPTAVDTDYFRPRHARQPGPVRVGWSGSAEPMKDYLPMVEEAIRAVAKRHAIEFVVLCDAEPSVRWPNVNVRHIPWNPATEVEDLWNIDIGLMPLPDGDFERCKCGTKAVLYMAAGIPAVVSPVGINREMVPHDEAGLHCTTANDWYWSIDTLVRDADLRRRMGEAGRRHAVTHYSRARALPILVDLFTRIGSRSMGTARGRSRPYRAA